jgi:hypothetical protein
MSTEPKKDVIYVDIEDDITSVIDKVKQAKTTIVALVPPKRIGVLQSIVNLKLLQRAATSTKKRIVLITSDQALVGLAAGLAIPVAKNLQSRPEVPETTVPETPEEEVINGEELPVGEHAKTADKPIELTGFPVAVDDEPGAAAAPVSAPFAAKAAARAPRKGSAIPDFNKFRKKMFLIVGGGIVLIGFFVWAIWFAPKATVSITARTNVVNINKILQLRPSAPLDTTQAVAPVTVKTTKKTASVDFTATGKKNIGDKATGTVKFTNAQDETTASIPAGTQVVSSSGVAFVTNAAVTVAAPTYGPTSQCGSDHLCEGTASVGVTAAGPGAKYNGASGTVNGSFDGAAGSFTDATTGGSDKMATVVTQDDFDKAKDQLSAQDSNKVKAELKKQFDATIITINESFLVEPGNPTSTPAVDAEAPDGKAKLTAETTYTLVGVKRNDLRAVFDTYTKSQISSDKAQKIYESGDENASFTEFVKKDDGSFTVRAQATAQVGPNIDDRALAKQLVKKRAGEIQQQIESIQGVEDVNVKFSPFWVTKAPGNSDRIVIKFVVKHD